MYYQERVINGILCCRHNPGGEWIEMSKKVVNLKVRVNDLSGI